MIFKTYVVGPIECNCYVIGCSETNDAAVVDPGGDSERIAKFLKDNSLNLKYILCTHGHFDHIGGVADLLDEFNVPVYISEKDSFLYNDIKGQGALFGISFRQPPVPSGFISEKSELKIGNIDVKVIETPGHTPGGLCFYIGGFILSGDTLFETSIGRTDLPGGSYSSLINSIKNKLLVFEDSVKVFPGHGSPTSIGIERRFNPYLK